MMMNSRYDIKGCLAGRYQSPGGPENPQKNFQVFKDQNFQGERLVLGEEREWFVRQIARDAEFLRKNKIVDYSLLVGIQRGSRQGKESQSSQTGAENIGQLKRLDSSERKAIWSSLVKLVDEGDMEVKDDHTGRIESRLSNFSAIVELLGEGSPIESPSKKSVTVLKKFLTPKRDKSQSDRVVLSSSSSTPTNSFQVHPSPERRDSKQGTFKNILSSIFGQQSRHKIHPRSAKQSAVYNSPYHHDNTVITAETVNDMFEIREAEGREFSLDNWQQYLGDRDSNRRNLNNEVNALHIVDGTDARLVVLHRALYSLLPRYYFGIIDIFTTYGWRQRLAHIVKNIQ